MSKAERRPIDRKKTHVRHFDYAPVLAAIWSTDEQSGLLLRDLGFKGATDGEASAFAIRNAGNEPVNRKREDVTFLYMLSGSVTVTVGADAPIALGPDDTINIPGGIAYTLDGFGPEFEALEVVFPIEGKARKVVTRESPEAYIAGNGPRKFFKYRDLGTAESTGGAVHIQVIKIAGKSENGTGWHYHSMGQFAYGLGGWGDVQMIGMDTFRLRRGDGLCICAGLEHTVHDFSDDYVVLEMCIPSQYDTIATQPPPAHAL